MEFHTLFQFFPSARAFTPRHFGVNAETLLYADQSNHWDWLADSGFSFVRIFAPDVNLRKQPVQPGLWGEISDEADFLTLRKQMRENPHGDLIDKDVFLFDQNIAWYGCLNSILKQCKNIALAPMLSVGWHPRMFPRPLLREDGSTDWEAAFCCYEYAFTVMHHCAEQFGMREFMTLNEPENQPDCWYLSEELDFCREGFGSSWSKLFRDDKNPTGLGEKYLREVVPQYAEVSRILRMALDDVKARQRNQDSFRLLGPACVIYGPLWEAASAHLDTLDFHHYGREDTRFPTAYRLPAEMARKAGKTVSCSEYNLQSGGMPIHLFPFSSPASMETVELLMTSLSLTGPNDPEMEYLAFYLFHFPSTHRNYKHLVYGDMNYLDWTGTDQKPWSRPENWHPSPSEVQIRTATPAYAMCRMLTRICQSPGKQTAPFPILHSARSNPTSAGPDDLHFHVRDLTVDQGDRVIINLLSPELLADGCMVDLSLFADRFQSVVIRQTADRVRDQVLSLEAYPEKPLRLNLPSNSLTQLILLPYDPAQATSLRLEEASCTPGSLLTGDKQLQLLQTTRLRAIATLNGSDIDLSECCVQWESSDPFSLEIHSTGLVQRLRDTWEPTTLRAVIPNGPEISLEIAATIGQPSDLPLRADRGICGLGEAD